MRNVHSALLAAALATLLASCGDKVSDSSSTSSARRSYPNMESLRNEWNKDIHETLRLGDWGQHDTSAWMANIGTTEFNMAFNATNNAFGITGPNTREFSLLCGSLFHSAANDGEDMTILNTLLEEWTGSDIVSLVRSQVEYRFFQIPGNPYVTCGINPAPGRPDTVSGKPVCKVDEAGEFCAWVPQVSTDSTSNGSPNPIEAGRPDDATLAATLAATAQSALIINQFEVPADAVKVDQIRIDGVQELEPVDGLQRLSVRATVTSRLLKGGDEIAEQLRAGTQAAAKQTDIQDLESMVMSRAFGGAQARNALRSVSVGSSFKYGVEAVVRKVYDSWEVVQASTTEPKLSSEEIAQQQRAIEQAAQDEKDVAEQVAAAVATAVQAAEAAETRKDRDWQPDTQHDGSNVPRSAAPESNEIRSTDATGNTKSLDTQFRERADEDCPRGFLGKSCRQRIREALCASRWTSDPAPGETECRR